jgi:hypothetical protein
MEHFMEVPGSKRPLLVSYAAESGSTWQRLCDRAALALAKLLTSGDRSRRSLLGHMA